MFKAVVFFALVSIAMQVKAVKDMIECQERVDKYLLQFRSKL